MINVYIDMYWEAGCRYMFVRVVVSSIVSLFDMFLPFICHIFTLTFSMLNVYTMWAEDNLVACTTLRTQDDALLHVCIAAVLEEGIPRHQGDSTHYNTWIHIILVVIEIHSYNVSYPSYFTFSLIKR